MTREEIFNLINKDRKEMFRDLSKAIGNNVNVIKRFVNDNLDTENENLDKNFEKNIKCACEILKHVNDGETIQDQGDVLYLAIVHLIDSFCMLEEKRLRQQKYNLDQLINDLMGGFKKNDL